jgi:septum formation protein
MAFLFPQQILLASKSPRRSDLLKAMGIDFRIIDVDVDEDYPENILPEDLCLYLAEKKFKYVKETIDLGDSIVITADTVVICDSEIMGKPVDINDARNKIKKLSGRNHFVKTGVCIGNKMKKISFSDTTEVIFEALTDEEIDYYIQNYEVFDKAGAYGIQDWIGIVKISAIHGSYSNVIGLPTQKLWKALYDFFYEK